MNKSPTAKRGQILGTMVEGMSIRAISRMTGASKNTTAKLLVEEGDALSDYQDRTLRNLSCNRNFVRVHQTLRVTPAMEAKVTDRLMSLEDVVAIVDA